MEDLTQASFVALLTEYLELHANRYGLSELGPYSYNEIVDELNRRCPPKRPGD